MTKTLGKDSKAWHSAVKDFEKVLSKEQADELAPTIKSTFAGIEKFFAEKEVVEENLRNKKQKLKITLKNLRLKIFLKMLKSIIFGT